MAQREEVAWVSPGTSRSALFNALQLFEDFFDVLAFFGRRIDGFTESDKLSRRIDRFPRGRCCPTLCRRLLEIVKCLTNFGDVIPTLSSRNDGITKFGEIRNF